MWWPDTEELAHSCEVCQRMQNEPPPVLLHPWTWLTQPWQWIHIDFTEPFLGAMFLVVDADFKWVEIVQMSSTTSSKTITEL